MLADLKQFEKHLGLLDEESREVARLIDSLASISLLAMDPSPVLVLIEKLDQEAQRIRRRRQLLEKTIAELSALNRHVENELEQTSSMIHAVD